MGKDKAKPANRKPPVPREIHKRELTDEKAINHSEIAIPFRYLALAGYSYMVIPISVFFLSWLKIYIGLPLTIILGIGLYHVMKKDYWSNKSMLVLPKFQMILISFAFLLWVWLSGQGGFFAQTDDLNWRNALFRDMINYSWPVIYDKNGCGLVYYLLHWIIPALFGKLFGWVGGNIALALWTYFGIMISFLLVVSLCGISAKVKIWAACIIFIFWSGLDFFGLMMMDIIGHGTVGLWGANGWLNYGWYSQYSCNDTLLAWVFNQTIVPWIAVPLFLENRKVRNFAFLGLCVLPFAPLPFLGLVIIMVLYATPYCVQKIKARQYKEIAGEIFSVPNLSAAFSILWVFAFYFGCNVAGANLGLAIDRSTFQIKSFFILLILFYLLQFGFYMILIYNDHKKDLLFKIVLISLLFIPFFKLGYGNDFCMRVSIPALFILMIMVIQYVIQMRERLNRKFFMSVLLIIALSFGAINPLLGIAERTKAVYKAERFTVTADNIQTFSDKTIGGKVLWMENFLVPNPETKAFYKYLARTDSKE